MPLTPHQLRALRNTAVADAGNRVAAATKLAGISQADLSRATGMTQQYVSDVARGRYPNLTLDNARRFADFFGCAIEDLFPAQQERATA